jgi:hypothetical protein
MHENCQVLAQFLSYACLFVCLLIRMLAYSYACLAVRVGEEVDRGGEGK